jgi:hypothetical protein
MELVIISDTHGQHEKLGVLPVGEVLIHAGDFTYFGQNKKQYKSFAKWFLSQPHKYKIFIAGNHEFVFEENLSQGLAWFTELPEWDTNTHYLQNSGVDIGGLYFYGAPQQPVFGNLAFNTNPPGLIRVWNDIPFDTDVLITHTPPLGTLDNGYGCPALQARLAGLSELKAHVFGHIHESFGSIGHSPISINAAMSERSHNIINRKPVVIVVHPR